MERDTERERQRERQRERERERDREREKETENSYTQRSHLRVFVKAWNQWLQWDPL